MNELEVMKCIRRKETLCEHLRVFGIVIDPKDVAMELCADSNNLRAVNQILASGISVLANNSEVELRI